MSTVYSDLNIVVVLLRVSHHFRCQLYGIQGFRQPTAYVLRTQAQTFAYTPPQLLSHTQGLELKVRIGRAGGATFARLCVVRPKANVTLARYKTLSHTLSPRHSHHLYCAA